MKIMRLAMVAGLLFLCCFNRAFAQNLANSQNAASPDWPMFGQNTANTASNSSETTISAKNVKLLRPNWTFATGGDVTARAAVVNGVAYFPDWAGKLYAV